LLPLLPHVCARDPVAAGLGRLGLTAESLADIGRDSLFELGRFTVAEYGLCGQRISGTVRSSPLSLSLSLSLSVRLSFPRSVFVGACMFCGRRRRQGRGRAARVEDLDWTEPAIFTDAMASLTSSWMLVMLVDDGRATLPGSGGCSPETGSSQKQNKG
jgi:hypothetical protein